MDFVEIYYVLQILRDTLVNCNKHFHSIQISTAERNW